MPSHWRVYPGDPRTGLTIGWVDWNPTPPDNNMGPWRGVEIVRTGAGADTVSTGDVETIAARSPAGDFPLGIPSLAARSPSPPLGVPSLTARSLAARSSRALR